MRDNGREWWVASEVAKVLNDKQSVYTSSGKSIGSHLKYCVAKDLVTIKEGPLREYRFNPKYLNLPLIPLLTQTLK